MQGSVEVPCERLSTSQYRDSAVIAYQPLTPLTDDDYSPLTNAFELQQTTIEQSREAFERIVEFQLQMSEAAISGTEVTGELYRQGIEMDRRALHSYLDAVEATLPRSGDAVAQIRDTIEEQFDQLEEQQQEALSMVEETIGDAEQSSDAYLKVTLHGPHQQGTGLRHY